MQTYVQSHSFYNTIMWSGWISLVWGYRCWLIGVLQNTYSRSGENKLIKHQQEGIYVNRMNIWFIELNRTLWFRFSLWHIEIKHRKRNKTSTDTWNCRIADRSEGEIRTRVKAAAGRWTVAPEKKSNWRWMLIVIWELGFHRKIPFYRSMTPKLTWLWTNCFRGVYFDILKSSYSMTSWAP